MLCENWQRINTSVQTQTLHVSAARRFFRGSELSEQPTFLCSAPGPEMASMCCPICTTAGLCPTDCPYLFLQTQKDSLKNGHGGGFGGQRDWLNQKLQDLILKCNVNFFIKKKKSYDEKRQIRGRINGNCLLKATWNKHCARLESPICSRVPCNNLPWSPSLFFPVCNWQLHYKSHSCRLACP